MEVHLEGGMPYGLMPGRCARSSNMPSLQHMMSYDDDDDEYGQVDEHYDPEDDGKTNQSENGSTDYDLIDEESEEEEEEEDGEEDEDDSQIHALIDDLETKFRLLVSNKVSEAEQFFDDATTFLHQRPILSHSTLMGTEQHHTKWDSSSNFLVEVPNEEEAQQQQQGGGGGGDVEEQSPYKSSYCVLYNDVSTQTDLEPPPPPVEFAHPIRSSDGARTLTGGEEDKGEASSEKARFEIGQLRDVRDSLVGQRRTWADQLKQTDERNEEELKKMETKVYEFEEAIEAVDTAIEFKNEVILGQPHQGSLASKQAPGSNEAQLVTRLETLSLEELQRLLCLYFSKVVALRSTSRRLEKHLEQAENYNEQLSRRLVVEHRHAKEMHMEHQNRIRLILSSNPNSAVDLYLRKMEDSLNAAKKKQHDLERSLTELLVRHGYLVNGADYDVKQVVKMLGIESQLAVHTQYRTHGGGGGAAGAGGGGGSTQPHHSRAWDPGSGWSAGRKQHRNAQMAGLGHRRNARQIDGHELQHIHREGRLTDGWERERDRDRERDRGDHRDSRAHGQQSAQPPQVHREKRRLIIQPAAPPSSAHSHHHHHHGSPSNHNNYRPPHHHSHQPPHGPSYK